MAESGTDATSPDRGLVTGYLLAHGGKTLFWTASDLYFVYYLNQVCHIAPATTGIVVGLSILFAALADAFTGGLLRTVVRTPAQAGRLQLAGGIGSAVLLVLFALTAFVAAQWRLSLTIAVLFVLRLTYALVDVPQNALLSFAPWTRRELTALVMGRNVVGGLSKMTLALAFVPVMASAPPSAAATRFLWLAAAIAVIMAATGIVLSARLEARHLPFASTSERPHNHLVIDLARMAVASIMLTGFTQLEPYLASQVINTFAAATVFLTTVSFGGVACQPLWRWRVMAAPRGRVYGEILLSACLAAACMMTIALDSLVGSAVTGLLCGLVSGGTLFLLWTEFAARTDGADAFRAFGRFTAAAKIGQGLAIILIGHWLQGQLASGVFVLQAPARWLAGGALIVGAAVLAIGRCATPWTSRVVYNTRKVSYPPE